MSLSNKVTPSSDTKYSLEQELTDESKDVEAASKQTDSSSNGSSNRKHSFFHLKLNFEDASLENVYREYNQRQKRTSINVLLLFSFLFTVSSLVMSTVTEILHPTSALIPHFVLAGTFFCITLMIFIVFRLSGTSLKNSLTIFLPWIMWALIVVEIFFVDYAFATRPHTAAGSVAWVTVFLYMTFVLFPFRLVWCILLSVGLIVTHTVTGAVFAATTGMGHFYIGHQVGANLMIFSCAVILGIISFISQEKKQRKAFLETKDSLSIKGAIEEKSLEQERLLLSVLPKHVADDMLKDMAAGGVTGQFRKIYMDRHENVSILFADIVGFTALSSACTATELVKVLNELFASFDILAKKYHQLRIKILGDCYYCISGAPTPRSDHAVLSVHMGLSVVEAIRMVREKTKSNVNMRVGIHTGAVLGGVIGQKQWQFDVLGKEVNLANKMESGGLPGRVHLSEATASFLGGEFELEPGEGDTREDAIKHAGMKTFLIKSIIKPYPQNTLDDGQVVDEPLDLESSEDGQTTNVEYDDNQFSFSGYSQSDDRLLIKALAEQEESSHMSDMLNPFTLQFKDKDLEEQYNTRSVHSYTLSLLGLIAISLSTFFAQLFILPKNVTSFVTFAVGLVFLTLMFLISALCKFDKDTRSSRLLDKRWLRNLWTIFTIIFMAGGDIVDFAYGCNPSTSGSPQINGTVFLDPNSHVCEYPYYFPYFAVLSLVGVTFLQQIDFSAKAVTMGVICALYAISCLVFVGPMFEHHDHRINAWFTIQSYPTAISSIILLNTLNAALVWLSRHVERTTRKMFMWRQETENQKEQIGVLRESNEKLVLNILPPHIAGYFIGAQKRDNDLLSQAYDEVGVMFAACPNFNDFYTEDAVNNNGLECLRFLNEVISDYDELLNEDRFRTITKIKTIGSTYMAASGLNNSEKLAPEAAVKERWKHLADLIEFALSLKAELDKINDQSFNSFVLRIGINHGPIIGGVIGARKPHYDIWGNTVNVASRMDSTGKAGRIQVVESTMNILTEFGYTFEKRGLVFVKGKGELMTYFLER